MKRVFTPVKKKTALLVDDDPLFLQVQHEKMQREGFRLEIASHAAGALQKLASGESIDLLLLDLNFPGTNGLEFLKDIRAKFPAEKLNIVVFSNPYLTSLNRQAAEAGASSCVPKSEAVEISSELQMHLVRNLSLGAAELLARLRTGSQAFARAETDEARQTELSAMHSRLRLLIAASSAGLQKISQMVDAFEALLVELHARPKKITPSVIRTVAQAVDSLAALFEQTKKATVTDSSAPKILVVDDDTISRETICAALEKAKIAAVNLDDSLAAQEKLAQENFDLIFLDVEMPQLNGFELCKKVREMPTNRSTPVVFVTAHSDFASRAQSALSGGNDFITKPFLSGELAVKALARLFHETPSSEV